MSKATTTIQPNGPWKTWGDCFLAHVWKGMDHSQAAHLADEWEKRKKRLEAQKEHP